MKKELEPNIEKQLIKWKKEILEIEQLEYDDYIEKLKQVIEEINQKEEKLNKLIEKRNELQEYKNQLRHIEKKSDTYNTNEYKNILKARYQYMSSSKLKEKLNKLSRVLLELSEKEENTLWNFIISILILRRSPEYLKQNGILMHLMLEEYYIKSLIDESEKILKEENFEKLKNQIYKLYMEEYIPTSKKILRQVVKKQVNIGKIDSILAEIQSLKKVKKDEKNPTPILSAVRDELIELYPIVLTTVDSVISNYWTYFKSGEKVDYIIIDESSQCDILSALPLLYIAENIIIVGDEKQLSAITDLKGNNLSTQVEDDYNYTKENFLSSIKKVINPPEKTLIEHYRCDYNIINYCNKFFYDNQLKIYKDAKKGAMVLVDQNKGKYAEKEANQGFHNYREIKCIDELIKGNIEGKFIITPFKGQSKILKGKYGEARCGTIHTFQGKGEKEVYLSATLNETKECINHLKGPYNLFGKELINVAVSRAKDKFVLVADAKFFKNYDENMKNLVEYIEIYGEKIPDKTVCIFDNLYKQIPTYKQTIKGLDNPYEEKIYELVKQYVEKHNQYKFTHKLPLAEFATDKKFLEENPELKDFILRNSHLDFSIYTASINKPIVAIEVDGEKHKESEQRIRDAKKERILKHMEIPLLRVPSKNAWDLEEFEEKIKEKLDEARKKLTYKE